MAVESINGWNALCISPPCQASGLARYRWQMKETGRFLSRPKIIYICMHMCVCACSSRHEGKDLSKLFFYYIVWNQKLTWCSGGKKKFIKCGMSSSCLFFHGLRVWQIKPHKSLDMIKIVTKNVSQEKEKPLKFSDMGRHWGCSVTGWDTGKYSLWVRINDARIFLKKVKTLQLIKLVLHAHIYCYLIPNPSCTFVPRMPGLLGNKKKRTSKGTFWIPCTWIFSHSCSY